MSSAWPEGRDDRAVGGEDRVQRLEHQPDAVPGGERRELPDAVRDPLPGADEVAAAGAGRRGPPGTLAAGSPPTTMTSSRVPSVAASTIARRLSSSAVRRGRVVVGGEEAAAAQRRDAQPGVGDDLRGLVDPGLLHPVAPQPDRRQARADRAVDGLLQGPALGRRRVRATAGRGRASQRDRRDVEAPALRRRLQAQLGQLHAARGRQQVEPVRCARRRRRAGTPPTAA